MIYFMQLGADGCFDAGLIKIGHAVSVKSRKASLQSEYGCQLTVLGVMIGNRTAEKDVHEQFSLERIGRRELFHPSDRLLHYISHQTHPWGDDSEELERADSTPEVFFYGRDAEWLVGLSKHVPEHNNCYSTAIDRALRLYASHVDFPQPPGYAPPPPDLTSIKVDGVSSESLIMEGDWTTWV